MQNTPTIGIVCCRKDIQGQYGQAVHEKYIHSISSFGGAPVLLPAALMTCPDNNNVLSMLDGVLLTGSYSNVAPHRYNAHHQETTLDEARDSLSFAILAYATQHDLPTLGLCRGLQEMNVYFGGTLSPDLSTNLDFTAQHKEDPHAPLAVQYGPAHDIHIAAGGVLSAFGEKTAVNSLHKQAIKDLAPALRIEATAPDGLIEAISHPEYRYMIGVQWHPEWQATQNPMSQFLFSHFIRQANAYQQQKTK